MNGLAGVGPLVRLILRRDRITLPLWVIVLAILPMATAGAFQELYTTDAAIATAAAGFGSNPAFLAMFGPVFGDTIGALVAWRSGLVPVIGGLISMMVVIRHTRAEEETGRRELLGATVVGRHAALAAVMLVVVGANLVLAAITTVTLVAVGQPVAGSLAFGLSIGAAGALFAGLGALTAQLSESAGTARGIGLAILGLFYTLRAAGDAGSANPAVGWLTWVSPFGWITRVRPFANERWWLLALPLLAALALGAVTLRMSARRDVGGALLTGRPGRASAPPSLASPLGLAWRLQRGLLVGWSAGFAVLGLIYGSVAESVGQLLKDTPEMADIFARLGGPGILIDAYIAGVMGILGLIAAAYGIQATLRVRAEEESLRTELVLAGAVARTRWLAGHLLFGFLGPAVALLTAGLTMGLSYGLIAGDVAGQLPRIIGAALVQLPAAWVVVGLVAALFGLAPALTSWSWAAYGAIVLLGLFGALLQFSQWIIDLSPFTHVPPLPTGDLTATPVLWLLGIGAVATVAAINGFRRRDLT